MYRIVWEFEAEPARSVEFEREYGREGAWAVFFRRGAGYVGTELFRSVSEPSRYVTVDRWTSKSAYEVFRGAFGAEYAALDGRCEPLTRSERLLAAVEEP